MKIQKVVIKEYKVLKDIDTNLDGKNILLIADNDKGKSTFINFIQTALGKKSNIPPDTTGSGYVIADKDGKQYTFKVLIKDGKSTVIIETEDGLSDNRRGTLAGIVGAMDLDIDSFVKLSETKKGQKEQVEIFKRLLPKETIDEIEKFERNVAVKFDERSDLNRDIEKLKGAISKHPMDNLPDNLLKEVKQLDTEKIYSELRAANEHNELVGKAEAKIQLLDNKLSVEKNEIDKLKEEISFREKIVETDEAEKKKPVEWLSKNSKKDVSELEKKIAQSSEQNDNYKHANELLKQRKDLEIFINESGEMTALIESERTSIQRTIKEMDSPVDELTFDEEKLIYKGFPVHPASLSTSAIMELGIKMKMAENPELGILFVEKTESLGAEKWKQLLEMSAAYGWQIIAEKVERGEEKLRIEIISE